MTADELAERIVVLESERGVVRTLHRYGHSIDYGLEAEWLDCFTVDGVFDVRARKGGTTRRYAGRDELAAFIAQHTRAPARYHKHLLVEPAIVVDRSSASVESYFVRVDATADGTPYLRGFGRYRDRLVECPDGTWRFVERIAEIEARELDPPASTA